MSQSFKIITSSTKILTPTAEVYPTQTEEQDNIFYVANRGKNLHLFSEASFLWRPNHSSGLDWSMHLKVDISQLLLSW